jgi:ribonuclease Z
MKSSVRPSTRCLMPLALLVLWITVVPSGAAAQALKVTLLGTGCPPPVMNRFGPSTLVEAGGERLVFDAGRGNLQRLLQAKIPLNEIDALFLTHLHSDHVVGIPDMLLTGWLVGRRDVPFRVWGPRGTKDMMTHLERAFEFDIRIRLYDDRSSPQGIVIFAEDIQQGVVYERNGVKVTAFDVDHRPIQPALGYRIDHGGRSVVLSGDTRFSENLIRFAQGTDVVIHSVAAPEVVQRGRPPERAKAILDHHTLPEEAGTVFARVQPKLAVFSHIVLPEATAQDLIPPARKHYAGPLELGEDLDVIEVGDTVTLYRARP